jgi:hypothetical protein
MARDQNSTRDRDQIDRVKTLTREPDCDEDEAAFETALKKLAEAKPLPKHEPKKRKPKG